MDIQKAYDTVQHDLRLACVGVQGGMLSAIKSLFASGTLSMKVGGTAGASGVQHMGVRQGCPLSPKLFGIFFDGLHQHMSAMALESGLVLNSGRHVPFWCYAADVVLVFDTSLGLQHLIDNMNSFCISLDLTISVAKAQDVVFHGAGSEGNWMCIGLLCRIPRLSSILD